MYEVRISCYLLINVGVLAKTRLLHEAQHRHS